MSWFRPTTSAITQLSEVCMALALLLYLLRFRNNTRDTYLIILGVVVSSISLFTAINEMIVSLNLHCLFIMQYLY